MALREELRDAMDGFVRRRGRAEGKVLEVAVQDCGSFRILCDLPWLPGLRIRSVTCRDVPALQDFGTRLGSVSKTMFCPYPWDDPSALRRALQEAVEHAVERVDASYVINREKRDRILTYLQAKREAAAAATGATSNGGADPGAEGDATDCSPGGTC